MSSHQRTFIETVRGRVPLPFGWRLHLVRLVEMVDVSQVCDDGDHGDCMLPSCGCECHD